MSSAVGPEENHEQHTRNNGELRKKAKKVPFLKLFSFADTHDYLLMALGSIGACVHGASVPVFSIFFGELINTIAMAYYYSPGSVSHRVAEYSLDFVYLGIVVFFSAWTEVACWMHTGERQAAKMRLAYLRAVFDQDIGFFDTEASTGEVIAAITSDVTVVQDAISEKAGNFLHYVSRFVAGFAVGFSRVWQISLLALAFVPLLAAVGGVYAYFATGLLARAQKLYAEAGRIAEEVLGNVRTVQAFVGEEKAVRSYRNALLKTYEYGKKAGLAKGIGIGALHFVLFCSWALLLWFAGVFVHQGVANGGVTFATMINVFVAGLSLGQAAPTITTFLKARAAAYPIFEMIEKNTAKKTSPSKAGRTLPSVDGHIQFHNVCFSYPSRPDVHILDGLNLDIPSGKILSLVGRSGSGKSTVISLIERFYEPLSGAILLDGHNIKELELKWLRKHIGLVNQEPALFGMSIRENILYGKDNATLNEVAHAAQLSGAITFINHLPDRFETQVGERGIQLSGGQKQCIAIARAILKNPSILLLDEATSALDAESEKSVQKALDRVMIGRTTIVVSHRLSAIRTADIIAIVQGGRIVETGTPEQLMLDPYSAYASLVQLQKAAYPGRSLQLESANIGRHLRYSREQSGRTMSFGPSFHSATDSASCYVSEASDTMDAKPRSMSMKELYSMVGPDWIFGMFGSIGALAAGSLFPLFALGITQALVYYYMDWDTTQTEIKKIALLFLGGAVVSIIFFLLEHLNFGIMGERLTLRVRERMFGVILRNEIGWFDNTSNTSAMLTSRLETDATVLQTMVADRSTIVLQNVGMIITSFLIAFILNWRITLVVLATYPLMVCGHMSDKIFRKGYGGDLNRVFLKASMLAAEAVSNIRTVAAFCSEEKVLDLYANELEVSSKHSLRRGQVAGILYGVSQFFLFSSHGLGLWYGSVLMDKGLSSFKSIIKCFMVLTVTAFSMGETLAMAPDIIKGNQMATSVFEVMNGKPKVLSDIGDEVGNVEGEIELRGVEFRYPSRPKVIIFRDFDLRVNAGKTMALVGTSGSGKSTVLALILRFYDPSAGKVMIDGNDIKKLQLKSLRRHIGLVQQEPALFATTVYDNILYGKDCATEAEVIAAAKLANAHSFISALPEGYLTEVGERGIQLSGGQKQRIAIARAIIKNPSILFLDEATSALDVESECVVQQALVQVMKGRTTIVVAHRLSTIQNANVISVLQDGKIIEQGNHSSLVENRNGAYFKMINLQHPQSQQQLKGYGR